MKVIIEFEPHEPDMSDETGLTETDHLAITAFLAAFGDIIDIRMEREVGD